MSLFGDINEVRLMGNITQDIELRYTPGGNAVANFSIATNRRYKQGDEWKDESEFHNIVVWGNLATGLSQRAKKGTRVMIIGRLQNRSWDGQDGQKKYRTEVVVDDAFLIDRYERGKMEGGDFSAAAANSSSQSNQAYDAGNAPAPAGAGKKSAKSKNVDPFADAAVDPDDLPF